MGEGLLLEIVMRGLMGSVSFLGHAPNKNGRARQLTKAATSEVDFDSNEGMHPETRCERITGFYFLS